MKALMAKIEKLQDEIYKRRCNVLQYERSSRGEKYFRNTNLLEDKLENLNRELSDMIYAEKASKVAINRMPCEIEKDIRACRNKIAGTDNEMDIVDLQDKIDKLKLELFKTRSM